MTAVLDGVFVFMLGFAIIWPMSKVFAVPGLMAVLLYVWHSLFTLVYYDFSYSLGADAFTYYAKAAAGDFDWRFGSNAVVAIAYPLVEYLGLSDLGVNAAFGIVGAIGLLAFAGVLLKCTLDSSRPVRFVAYLFPFLPSLSFWSAALGKDAISFCAACLFTWAALHNSSRLRYGIIAVFLMTLVRPHIAILMLVGLISAELLASNRGLVTRLLLVVVGVTAAIFVLPQVLGYVGLDADVTASDIGEYVSYRQSVNALGGSSFDLASMNPVSAIFAYVFRPTILESRTLLAVIYGVENGLLLAGFTVAVIKMARQGRNPQPNLNWMPLTIYAVLALIALSQTTANLGIAARQKWMFLPPLIAVAFALFPVHHSLRAASQRVIGASEQRSGQRL